MLAETPKNVKQDQQNSSRQNQIAAPSISLPKGGGAIRGIGEKFAANPVTGTGSMTIPIATSPGRSGFGPQLALSYIVSRSVALLRTDSLQRVRFIAYTPRLLHSNAVPKTKCRAVSRPRAPLSDVNGWVATRTIFFEASSHQRDCHNDTAWEAERGVDGR
ncbi:MAG TPA: SpvB/TcaC N-terminal domain-containing protein [Ktedonobacteraceae bacterium]|nr:SpvB/TcaC N-terminal domain-containing protein [Ktedonobacteraceae bacterium]